MSEKSGTSSRVPSLQKLARDAVRKTLQQQAKTEQPLTEEGKRYRDVAKHVLKNTPIEIEETKRATQSLRETKAAKTIQRSVKDMLKLTITSPPEDLNRYQPSVKAKFENKKIQFILNSNSMYFHQYMNPESIKNAEIIGKNMVKIELDRHAPRVSTWANTYIEAVRKRY